MPQSGTELLQGPVAAQVALGVRVEALFDAYVSSGLPPQVFGRLGEPRSLSAQCGALHFLLLRARWILFFVFLSVFVKKRLLSYKQSRRTA